MKGIVKVAKLDHSNIRVLCIGRVLLDIIVKPDKTLFTGEDVIKLDNAHITYGGSAANTSIELARLNIKSYISGLLGDDSISFKIKDILQSHNVDTSKLYSYNSLSSSFCLIPLDKRGTPSYYYYLGADSNIDQDILLRDLKIVDFIKTNYISHVHIAGINLLPLLDGDNLFDFLTILRNSVSSITISADTSKVLQNSKINKKSLPLIDILFCNEKEASALADSTSLMDIKTTITPDSNKGSKICIVKLGERGSAILRPNKEIIICPAYRVTPRNLNGAGDIFAAKFIELFSLLNNEIDQISNDEIQIIASEANKAAATYISTSIFHDEKSEEITSINKTNLFNETFDIESLDKQAFSLTSHVKNFSNYRTFSENILKKWISIIQNLINTSGKDNISLLDAGCGIGRLCIPISQRIKDIPAKITAIDSSFEMIDYLNKHVLENKLNNIESVKTSILDFNPKYCFDIILLSEVIHFFSNKEELFSKCIKMLNENGMVIIRAPSHIQLRQNTWYEYFQEALNIDLARHVNFNIIYSVLEKCGFQKIELLEIDETSMLEKDYFIKSLENKCYSTLHLLEENTFSERILDMKKKLKTRKKIKNVMKMNCIIAWNS